MIDFIIQNWPLILLAMVSGGLLAWPRLTGAEGGAARVTPGQAVQLMNREKAVVVDVCEAEEFAQGHIKGAINAPLSQFKPELAGLPKNKATPVVVTCATGIRSGRAAAQLRKAGYENASSLEGGNRAWKEAQYALIKGA